MRDYVDKEKPERILIYRVGMLYQTETEILSSTQINLLIAVLNGEKQLTSVSAMNTYRLSTPRNVSRNKMQLINNDIIQATKDGFEFVDPAFELWFRQTYLNQPIHKYFIV